MKDPQTIWTLIVAGLVSAAAIYQVLSGPNQLRTLNSGRTPQSETQELLRPSALQ